MPYPSAPWNLQGHAFQTVNLLHIDRVQPFIPAELQIVSVVPGKTLGGMYVGCYGADSTLSYSELIVVSAIVQKAGQLGAWISHIYVDNPDSVDGGRNIWGLPKQLAQFRWGLEKKPQVQVYQGDTLLCTLGNAWKFPGWQQSLKLPVFSMLHSKLMTFEGQATFNFYLAGIDLQVPSQSPFAELGVEHPLLGFYLEPLHLVAGAPSTVLGAR
ncbi:MAG TPA: acetoacetate decarboxylase family protein [Coleofasciculaceae cyanobacterium]